MKIILLSLFLMWSFWGFSQQVVATSGTDFSNGSAQISYTLGETVTFTGVSPNTALTQGFQQPSVKVTGVSEVLSPEIKVYPNPTTTVINIEIATSGTYQLYDLNGKLVSEGELSAKSVIDMSSYATATYMLNVTEGQSSNRYKIIKLN